MVTFYSVLTLVLFVGFIGIIIWAWSAKRKKDFEEAARLPLDDEPESPAEKRDDG